MLSSANTEKIRDDEVLLRLVLVSPATLPPAVVVWVLALGSSSLDSTHSVPRVSTCSKPACSGRLTSPWAVRSRRVVV